MGLAGLYKDLQRKCKNIKIGGDINEKSMMVNPILELIDVNRAFGGVVTANNVSFELYPGETLGLIGPNGAGKTTILNLISGIYDVDSGRILYNLNDITKVAPHDRAHLGIARTFQSPRFLQRSNMEDNMLLSLDLSSHTNALRSFFAKKDKKFRKDVEDLVEIAGLDLDWEEDIYVYHMATRNCLK